MSNAKGARPTGVTVIGVLNIIAGVLGLLGGIAVFFSFAIFSGITESFGGSSDVSSFLFGYVFLLAILGIVLGIFKIVLGIAFFGMKPWAWKGMLIVTVLSTVIGLISMDVLSLVISGVVLYYLFTAPIKKLFGATFGPSF